MKFSLFINVKMPTIVGILTCMSGENNILSLTEPWKGRISWYFYTYEHLKFHAQLSWAWKKFYNLGTWFLLAVLSPHLRNRKHVFVLLVSFACCPFFSSTWSLGTTAVCDCGIYWISLSTVSVQGIWVHFQKFDSLFFAFILHGVYR